MNRDLYSNCGFFQAIQPQTASATVTGADVDLRGYDGAVFVLTAGRLSYVSTTSYWALRIQHTDPSALGAGPSDYADVLMADVIGPNGTSLTSGIVQKLVTDVVANGSLLGSAIYKVGYRGNKRYARMILELVGNASNVIIAGVAHLGLPGEWAVNERFDIN